MREQDCLKKVFTSELCASDNFLIWKTPDEPSWKSRRQHFQRNKFRISSCCFTGREEKYNFSRLRSTNPAQLAKSVEKRANEGCKKNLPVEFMSLFCPPKNVAPLSLPGDQVAENSVSVFEVKRATVEPNRLFLRARILGRPFVSFSLWA